MSAVILLHHVDALDLSSCRCFPAKKRYSCSLGFVAVRRPSHRLGGLGVGRILLKRLGEGNLQASLGMHDPNPMKSKTSSCFLADLPSVWASPKNSVILASAMTQSGVLGKR